MEMDTRSQFPDSPLFDWKSCVYCGGEGDTNDHAPPRCFLRKPLPSNLITLPACKVCNSGFSFDEDVVKTIIALTSTHPDLVAERQPGGRIERAMARSRRFRSVIENARRDDGNYELSGELLASFDRVMRKTVQGVFFGLYQRLVSRDDIEVLLISDQRFATPEQVVDQIRPPQFRDITDEPLPEITPSSWPVREPVFFLTLQPESERPPVQRLFRLIRETPVIWEDFQPDVFRFGFVKSESGRAVCVMDLWKTLVVAVAAPWPDGRGPLRRGRKNPRSRDRRPQ
ncbi:MAG: hypothetical protein JNK76_26765 [Planctomycetales bacterium]|nr:hypothetical protein [Planctomycetales bacterium]